MLGPCKRTWNQSYLATTVDVTNESSTKRMEEPRHHLLYIPGRHLIVGTSKTSVARSLDFVCNSPQEWRQRKVKPHTIASCEPFGLRSQFRARSSPCALKQTEKCEERATKLVTKEKVTYKPGLQIPPPQDRGKKRAGEFLVPFAP